MAVTDCWLSCKFTNIYFDIISILTLANVDWATLNRLKLNISTDIKQL